MEWTAYSRRKEEARTHKRKFKTPNPHHSLCVCENKYFTEGTTLSSYLLRILLKSNGMVLRLVHLASRRGLSPTTHTHTQTPNAIYLSIYTLCVKKWKKLLLKRVVATEKALQHLIHFYANVLGLFTHFSIAFSLPFHFYYYASPYTPVGLILLLPKCSITLSTAVMLKPP